MSAIRRLARAIGLPALGGLVVWAIVAVVAWRVDDPSLDLVAVLLLFAQLVVVPMALALVTPPPRRSLPGALFRLGRAGFRIGAVAVLVSLALPRGELAAAVAALYLVPALLVAAGALPSIDRGRDPSLPLAGASLAAAALLFVLHRQDVAFSWLPELRLHLASVHLHVVGVGLVAMAGAAARFGAPAGRAAAVVLGVGALLWPLAGLADPWGLPAIAVTILAGAALLGLATVSRLSDARIPGGSRRLLFVSLALSAYVVLVAVLGALGEAAGGAAPDLGSMVRVHGSLGVIGVVFVGLLGWRLAEPDRRG